MDPSTVLTFKLGLIAICHDINWDFLNARLGIALPHVSDLDLAKRMADVSPRDVEGWLDGYKDPSRIKAKERAALLKDVGQKLLEHFDGHAISLYSGANGRLAGHGGFYSALDSFDAYRADPLRKKSERTCA